MSNVLETGESSRPVPDFGVTNSTSISGDGEVITSRVSSTVTAIFVVAPSYRVKTSLTTVRKRLSKTSFAKRLGAATNKVVWSSL